MVKKKKLRRLSPRGPLWMMALLGGLTGAGLLGGGYLGVRLADRSTKQVEDARLDEVTAQARLLSENVWHGLDMVRTQAMTLASTVSTQSAVLTSGLLEQWVAFESRTSGTPGEAVRGSAMRAGASSTAIIALVKEKISAPGWADSGVSLMRLKPTTDSPREFLVYVFVHPQNKNVVLAAAFDPSEVFSAFRRFSARSEEGRLKGYLVAEDGFVLAHSQPSSQFVSIAESPFFREKLRAIFGRDRVSGAGSFPAGPQRIQVAAYLRIQPHALGVVVERNLPSELTPIWTSALGLRWAGQALLVFSLLILLTGVGSVWLLSEQRRSRIKNGEDAGFDEVFESAYDRWRDVVAGNRIPPSGASLAGEIGWAVDAAPSNPSESALLRELQHTQETLRAFKAEAEMISKFEREAVLLRDTKSVAGRLTELTTRLCQSPSLFFAYQSRTRSVSLEAHAGLPGDELPLAMHFGLDPITLDRITDAAKSGAYYPLSNYEPLGQVLMVKMGVANFDAWAVTGYGHLGRAAMRPRVLGILVVLRSGTEALSRTDTLSRMMRATGLVYENALLSQ